MRTSKRVRFLLCAAPVLALVEVMFVAPLVVVRQYSALSPGDRVVVRQHGIGPVVEVRGEEVLVEVAEGQRVWVPAEDAVEQ